MNCWTYLGRCNPGCSRPAGAIDQLAAHPQDRCRGDACGGVRQGLAEEARERYMSHTPAQRTDLPQQRAGHPGLHPAGCSKPPPQRAPNRRATPQRSGPAPSAVRRLAVPLIRLVTVLFAVTALSFLLLNLLPAHHRHTRPGAGNPVAHEQLRKELHQPSAPPCTGGARACTVIWGQSYSDQTVWGSAIGWSWSSWRSWRWRSQEFPLGVFAARRPDPAPPARRLAMPSFMLGARLRVRREVNVFPWMQRPEYFHIRNGAGARLLDTADHPVAAGQLAVFGRAYVPTLRRGGSAMAHLFSTRAVQVHVATVLGRRPGPVGGSIIVEQLFAPPGMGSPLVETSSCRAAWSASVPRSSLQQGRCSRPL